MRMVHKGINQIDFAVAVGLVIVVFAFTLSHVSGYYSAPRQAIDSAELRTQAIGLWDTVFSQEGVPSNWHWKGRTTRPSTGGNIWKVPIHIEPDEAVSGDHVLSVTIEPGETDGVPHAWTESVVVYEEGSALQHNIENEVEDNGFLEKFDLVFELSIDEGESKNIEVYYSQDNTTSVEYDEGIGDPEDVPANITIFSEVERDSVLRYKAQMVEDMFIEDLREKYSFDGGFNISFETGLVEFSQGEPIPPNTDVEIYSRSTLVQDKNGSIEKIEPRVAVW